jgi:hypothetical protein
VTGDPRHASKLPPGLLARPTSGEKMGEAESSAPSALERLVMPTDGILAITMTLLVPVSILRARQGRPRPAA